MPKLNMTNSDAIINTLKSQFARWGVPEHLRTDGGPQFTSSSFQKFCKEMGITHTTSDPHYQQGNGAAERAVQTVKRILKQDDPYLALMTYRSTPIPVTGCAPSQLIMGRHMRTRLPMQEVNLSPQWPNLKKVKESDAKAKKTSAECYNKTHGARELPPIDSGTLVRERTSTQKKWSAPAPVEKKVGDRSYVTNDLLRNRRHLQVVPANTNSITKEDSSSLISL